MTRISKSSSGDKSSSLDEISSNERIATWRVILVIVMIALAVVTAIALISYNSADPSLHSSNAAGVISNKIGIVGAYLSDILFQLFGILAYGVPVVVLSFGLFSLRPVKLKKLIAPVCALLLAFFSVGSLLYLGVGNRVDLSFSIGGWIAQVFVDLTQNFLGYVGTTIVMAFLLAVAIVIGFSEMAEKVSVWVFSWLVVSYRRLVQKITVRNFGGDANEAEDKNSDFELAAENEPGTGDEPVSVDEEPATEVRWVLGEIENDEEQDEVPVLPPLNYADASDMVKPVSIENSEVAPAIVTDCKNDNDAFAMSFDNQETGSYGRDDSGLLENEPDLTIENRKNKLEVLPEEGYPTAFEDEESSFDFGDIPQEEAVQPSVVAAEARSILPAPVSITRVDNGATAKELQQASKEQEKINAMEKKEQGSKFTLPSSGLLDFKEAVKYDIDKGALDRKCTKLLETLASFGIRGEITNSQVGPVVTVIEFVPAPGIKVSKISSLADDLAMSLQAMQVRIVAPIPGKGAVGIEIPSEHRQVVYLKEIIDSKAFREAKSKVTLCLGKDVEGQPYVADLAKMPHLLIAGATGTGKSVGINAMLTSILYKATADDVRLIMVDPKQLELSIYEGIPHLLLPVVCDPKKASLALHWAVEEMERRYGLMAELGVRNLAGYNEKIKELGPEDLISKDGQEFIHLPYIVILIDEFADLMMVASKEIETYVARLAQKARAAGIHLILATQRPSVDVITGTIKANFPSRISFQVSSGHDAKTILDTVGSEHLLGMGDMLFMSAGGFGLTRVHGALVTEKEIDRVVNFLKAQGEPQYDESILSGAEEGDGDGEGSEGGVGERPLDELYDKAVAFAIDKGKISISMLQRYLGVGYNRSANIVERMERDGLVGAANGSKPREVLVGQDNKY